MDLKQNVNNLIKMIEAKTNLLLILYRYNDGFMLEMISVKNDSSNEVLNDLVIKRYDDLLGMYKFIRGIYKTIKLLEFNVLEIR